MDIPVELKKQIEYSFLKSIIAPFNQQEITREQAMELAKEVLPVVDSTTMEEFEGHVTALASKRPLFQEAGLLLTRYHEEAKTRNVLDQMRAHMQSGDVSSALQVAQSA